MPLIENISIPLEQFDDQLLWKHSTSGDLSLKEAYLFFSPANQKLGWAKLIWHNSIPPSNSFMMWRLLHNKIATDEVLASRGRLFPSMCSLCSKNSETTLHLFLQCPFALSIWNWFSSVVRLKINLASILDVFSLCNRSWNPQCQIVIVATVISIFKNIWICRNKLRFQNAKPSLNSTIALIMASSSLTGTVTSLTSSPSISDFEILKHFKVAIHHPKAPKIVEVIWSPPLQGWVKCNTDGTSVGNPGIAACAGIFRNNLGANLGCFAHYIGVANALYAEIMGIILAIECAVDRNWRQLWIESDSMLVISAFKNVSIIPWPLKNR
jgi:hypothetical protein